MEVVDEEPEAQITEEKDERLALYICKLAIITLASVAILKKEITFNAVSAIAGKTMLHRKNMQLRDKKEKRKAVLLLRNLLSPSHHKR